MKKIVLTIALVLTMCIGASAQSDGFFRGGDDFDGNRGGGGATPLLPYGNVGTLNNDQPATAPLGTGLLILSALGGVYMLRKKIYKQ